MMSRERLHTRAAFLQSIRQFFTSQEFMEVDTPVLHPLLLPEANIQPISAEGGYLQTSPEICMKRILALGCEKIFQICPCFRKEERGRYHLEEFTLLEWYRLGDDYTILMADCERLIKYLLDQMGGLPQIKPLFSEKIDWQRLTVAEAFETLSPISLQEAINKECFDEVLVEHIEPSLGVESPTILYDYPLQFGSLARRKGDGSNVAERFELYIHGVEIANGFSELTDEVEQRQRFESERETIEKQYDLETLMPEKFLRSLDDIDTAAGIALGIDRLLMLLLGEHDVAAAVSFAPEDL